MSSQVADLFNTAVDEGSLSPQALASLNVADIGAQIQAGLGISADLAQSSSDGVILLGGLLDDSSSIHSAGNEPVVRDGWNSVLDALLSSKQADSILVHCAYLNGTQFPFAPLKQAVRLDANNYHARGGTPLYDMTLVMLGRMIAKTQEFSNNGVPVRAITFTLTDGADYGSSRRPQDVEPVIRDMLRAGETNIVGAMGIDDGSTDFRAVFQRMGYQKDWILTPKNSASDIRKAFAVFSQSAVRASQGGASFSKTAMGGFGTP